MYTLAMKLTQNLHTHSTFCDGKNSLEENILSAIEQGLDTIGFSSHYPPNHDPASIKAENVDLYFGQLDALSDKYRGKIRILKGFEVENINTSNLVHFDPRCEYTIGAVHQFLFKDEYIGVDASPEIFKKALEKADNNVYSLIENYYNQVIEFSRQPYTITAHFDLITKFNEKFHFFNDEDKKYKDIAMNALEEVANQDKIFELNTGAISRGWKTSPYPAPFLLKRLKELNVPVIVSSDAHRKENLTCAFDYCADLLKNFGFKQVVTF